MNSTMQEKDILADILNFEKEICLKYSNFLIESSCPKERTVLTNNLSASAQDQYTVFDKMSKLGYYPVKNAKPEEVKTVKDKAKTIQSSMN